MKIKYIVPILALLPRLLVASGPGTTQEPPGVIIHPGSTNPPPCAIDISFWGQAKDPEHVSCEVRLDAKKSFSYREPFGYGASLLLWEGNKMTLHCTLQPGKTNETEILFSFGIATSTLYKTYFSYAESMAMHATSAYLYNLGEYYQHSINISAQPGPGRLPQGDGPAGP